MNDALTPSKGASRLTHQLNLFSAVHGTERFPIDVAQVALEAANLFRWDDPIVEVKATALKSFEGALFDDGKRSTWMLLYNDQLSSGRVRFTQAHELGHYVLHRQDRNGFQCAKDDMLKWGDEQLIEGEANQFAANLLMPLDDFRVQVDGRAVSLESLGLCAERYGVSLTASALRWIAHTHESAVLVASRDGFMLWAVSSNAARRNGAFFKTRQASPIELPVGSLAADNSVAHEKKGRAVGSSIWFPKAEDDFAIREMKVGSEQYDIALSLLLLPRSAKAWAPWDDHR